MVVTILVLSRGGVLTLLLDVTTEESEFFSDATVVSTVVCAVETMIEASAVLRGGST